MFKHIDIVCLCVLVPGLVGVPWHKYRRYISARRSHVRPKGKRFFSVVLFLVCIGLLVADDGAHESSCCLRWPHN